MRLGASHPRLVDFHRWRDESRESAPCFHVINEPPIQDD